MAFPREGFTIDVIGNTLNKTILNPYLTLPIAAAIAWLTKNPDLAPAGVDLPLITSSAKTIFYLAGLGTALATNRFLTKWSANNWTPTKPGEWNWDKEIVLVTGGSSGVGASIVKNLLHRNPLTKIIIVDFAPLAFPPPTNAKNIHYYQCDLSDTSLVKTTCARIKSEIGHPTVLINNAGLGRGKPLLDCSYADIEVTIKSNLIASFLLVNEFLPEMVKHNHGHILHTSSMTAIVSPPRATEYSATKAGINSLHEALQLELVHNYHAPRVRLSLGIFGFIDSPMFHGKATGSPHFMIPLLHVDTVGEEFVDVLYGGYGKTFYLPGMMRYVSLFRAAPEWLLRMVRETAVEGTRHFRVPRQEIDEVTGRLLRTVY